MRKGPKVGEGLPGSARGFYVEASPQVVPYPHISNSLALALPDPNWVKEMEFLSSCPSTSSFFGNYLEQVSSFNAIKPSIISSSSTSAPAEVSPLRHPPPKLKRSNELLRKGMRRLNTRMQHGELGITEKRRRRLPKGNHSLSELQKSLTLSKTLGKCRGASTVGSR
ncbi:hypothetical protein Ocin01_19012 [Orchesella cincta]|uniref:Uncharacterized protein n=1 Tax=Orchesella cincta TaxID=48709 RepID=A0A1D2M3X4_ORCCI|nr:hypothetical protein Ocin01_19012 [Orchesella cincta]